MHGVELNLNYVIWVLFSLYFVLLKYMKPKQDMVYSVYKNLICSALLAFHHIRLQMQQITV